MGKAAFLGTLHPVNVCRASSVTCGLQEFLIVYPAKKISPVSMCAFQQNFQMKTVIFWYVLSKYFTWKLLFSGLGRAILLQIWAVNLLLFKRGPQEGSTWPMMSDFVPATVTYYVSSRQSSCSVVSPRVLPTSTHWSRMRTWACDAFWAALFSWWGLIHTQPHSATVIDHLTFKMIYRKGALSSFWSPLFRVLYFISAYFS